MKDNIVTFMRKKDLRFVRELGQGACGRTVQLHDDVIDEAFVCKKFSPITGPDRSALFESFKREIKILHMLHHTNVVRVFNYYLYPEQSSGYILMELVDGFDIEDYITFHPEQINDIFRQTIEGFAHLESNGILHRDIRPQNIMVSASGVVKIIDFGFGKKIAFDNDFDKSITLNWWCEPPREFQEKIYDFSTEVYFIGKMLEKFISDNDLEEFKYKEILKQMCSPHPTNRSDSFISIRQEILAGCFRGVEFSYEEMSSYRNFSEQLFKSISKIMEGAKYHQDIDGLERRLDETYRSVMLEETIPKNQTLINCFLSGSYYYSKNNSIKVPNLKSFLALLRSCSKEKKEIVLANIRAKLDAIPRYDAPVDLDEDIPF